MIEGFLGMQTGYVLDYSNKTFGEFVEEVTGIDVFSGRYNIDVSKANRLRAFMREESNYNVGKLLASFCEYYSAKLATGHQFSDSNHNYYEHCLKLSDQLKQEGIVEHMDAFKSDTEDKDFNVLSKLIKESIEKNEPETALDRLHTYMMKYFRQLCEKHTVDYNKDEALNSLYGKYIKKIISDKHIESEMTEKILKYSVNIFEAFNGVRNNQSFAHDNPVLNYQESVLIFNNISNMVKFIQDIENKIPSAKIEEKADWNDLPF